MSGRKIKKVSIVFFAIILLTAFGLTQAMAASFTDITAAKYDWARPYIEKMNLLGVVKGMTETTYGPDNSVTREQLITMLVRLMGWESQATGKSLPSTFPKANSVAPWARGYVALAVEKGIVSGEDLENFRPADAATRSEVAVFAVKAIGLGQEAESRKTFNASLSFTDGYLIELKARPYIEIAVEKGIMKGFPDGSFKPNEKVTRAQIATVLHNVTKLAKANSNMVKGIVKNVDSTLLPSIDAKLDDGSSKTYIVNTYSTLIYKEDADGNLTSAQLKDIKPGDTVNIIASGNTAQYVEIAYGKQATVVEDENEDKDKDKDKDKLIKGIIRGVNISANVLTIENKDNDKYESYNIASDAKIRRDGTTSDIYKLMIGDTATVTVTDGKIVRIEAETATKEITGVITDITFAAKNPTITIEGENGRENDYELGKNVTIRKNNRSADISDLKIGDEVKLTLEYGVGTRVVATSTKQDISGTVKAVTLADINTITVVDDKGREHVIKITRDTEITKDRKQIDVTDIRPNYYVDIEAENDEAISIDVTVRNVKETIRGTVVNINEQVKVIVINIKNDDGTKSTQHVYYTSDTILYKENREVRISRIAEGDEVICIGGYEGGLFFADTIHDITISD
ncbi:S-layer homology domain-containing protein [Tepidanaerobacter sp. EBM-38]|uniref:S-layer homology domain-containing protein n=1 Tax=Tepidanaerobacter sp. EBM-38 TaxID=1918496 RepID=UPI000AE2D706|nr:S-layer homology domain-containing protein [Tepidanaerobacter sp. EBM-38]